jgi:hypothetical protein
MSLPPRAEGRRRMPTSVPALYCDCGNFMVRAEGDSLRTLSGRRKMPGGLKTGRTFRRAPGRGSRPAE